MLTSFQIALDKYLTTPPNTHYDQWYENLYEEFSDDFYENNEFWVENSKQIEIWIEYLYNRQYSISDAVKLIEKTKNNIKRNEMDIIVYKNEMVIRFVSPRANELVLKLLNKGICPKGDINGEPLIGFGFKDFYKLINTIKKRNWNIFYKILKGE